MPSALLSPDPDCSARALNSLIEEADTVAKQARNEGGEIVFVGYSLGTYPAAVLANRYRARLFAVSPSDRADLMLWESDAVAAIRSQAEKLGFTLKDFSNFLEGLNLVDNLENLASGSTFIFGKNDPFVPAIRTETLQRAISHTNPNLRNIILQGGHVRTLIVGAALVHRSLSVRRERLSIRFLELIGNRISDQVSLSADDTRKRSTNMSV
jgi:fermentation-respiration switch protein FrsA (DUF1100 family)